MAVTAYRVLKAPINQMDSLMTEALAGGWQPLGTPFAQYPNSSVVYQALIKGTPDGGGGGPVTITIEDISDAGSTGKAVLATATAAEARTAIGAGTSNLQVGTEASQAAAGNHTHAVATIEGLASTLSDIESRLSALEP